MKYDVIVIGGGLAGYTSALRCLEHGLKTALINSGKSALHFSSGSVELLAATPEGTPVHQPLAEIARFPQMFPEHPYARIGVQRVSAAVDWFTETMCKGGLILTQDEKGDNHQRITTLGAVKSTYLSQPFTEHIGYHHAGHNFDRIRVLAISGFRDFQSQVVADNLRANRLFSGRAVSVLPVNLLQNGQAGLSYRSSDLAALLQQEANVTALAEQISRQATRQDLIVVPAVFGSADGLAVLHRLKQATGLRFHEVPTMPPSQMGIRLEEVLESRFTRSGGVLLKGDRVVQGRFCSTDGGLKLMSVRTSNLHDFPLMADTFIQATGSFFSNGLKAERDRVTEPVFGLDICVTGERSDWKDPQFFAPRSHAFMSFGVETNRQLQPSVTGETVQNLYCCGSLLAHYNPVAEGSGGGVAISSGYYAAEKAAEQAAAMHSEHAASQVGAEEAATC